MVIREVEGKVVQVPEDLENQTTDSDQSQVRGHDSEDLSEEVVNKIKQQGPDTGAYDIARQAELQGKGPSSVSFLQALGARHEPTPYQSRIDQECGIELCAHLGVPGDQVPPPPPLPRLTGLKPLEAAVQARVIAAVERNVDIYAQGYFDRVKEGDFGPTNIFGVDDAKLMFPEYNPLTTSDIHKKEAHALYNTVVHQAAAAIAKRAFLIQLDTLSPGDQVLVTNGGCASGKSYALQNADGVGSAVEGMGAVWDAAGEACSTENKWVLDECRKRGLKPTFVYVYADPIITWGHTERGVIVRAERKGRMVNALSFVESYSLGAQNFEKFYETYKNDDDVEFLFLDNQVTPRVVNKMPREALRLDGQELYDEALRMLHNRRPSTAIMRGGDICRDVWGDNYAA